MAVHLTRIYTKAGDAGMTRLSNNEQVPKTDPRIAAYADVDECNAAIGVALALGDLDEELRGVLASIQNDLFDVGADLSTPVEPEPKYPPLRVTEEYVERLEGWCDEYNARLSKLDSFILPGGTAGAALLHVARDGRPACRTSGWALRGRHAERTSAAARYLNRLSDLLFILARRPTRAATCSGSRARTAAPTPSGVTEPFQAGGADSTQERKPVTVELSIASSRGPSGVEMDRTTTSEGSARSSRFGLRRDSTWSSARESRC